MVTLWQDTTAGGCLCSSQLFIILNPLKHFLDVVLKSQSELRASFQSGVKYNRHYLRYRLLIEGGPVAIDHDIDLKLYLSETQLI